MLKFFAIALLVAAVAADLDIDWAVFKATHKKKYSPEVDEVRKFIYNENKEYIDEHNKLYSQGRVSYFMGENEFTDMTHGEFVATFNGMKVKVTDIPKRIERNFISLPETVDWRPKGYVTPVKNQGQCGSCWSFSATGSMEGQHFKKTGKLVSLSEQNLVDCSKSFHNHGCKGGLMDYAFRYVIANHGIDTEASYPYKAEDGRCHFTARNVGATISGFRDIPRGSESELQAAVASIGPISIAIDASHRSFQHYKGGVYNEPLCSSSKLDHGVLAVGYGTENSTPYWLVKNSWGTTWGKEGYILMSRNKDNQCGIATVASYPVV